MKLYNKLKKSIKNRFRIICRWVGEIPEKIQMRKIAKECEVGKDPSEKPLPNIEVHLERLTKDGAAMIALDPNNPEITQKVVGFMDTEVVLPKKTTHLDGSTTEIYVKTKVERMEDSYGVASDWDEERMKQRKEWDEKKQAVK